MLLPSHGWRLTAFARYEGSNFGRSWAPRASLSVVLCACELWSDIFACMRTLERHWLCKRKWMIDTAGGKQYSLREGEEGEGGQWKDRRAMIFLLLFLGDFDLLHGVEHDAARFLLSLVVLYSLAPVIR